MKWKLAVGLTGLIFVTGCAVSDEYGNQREPVQPVEVTGPPTDAPMPADFTSESDFELDPATSGGSGITCKDVTSFDYNWDNDMLCTRPDGSQFYTDYAGAAAAQS